MMKLTNDEQVKRAFKQVEDGLEQVESLVYGALDEVFVKASGFLDKVREQINARLDADVPEPVKAEPLSTKVKRERLVHHYVDKGFSNVAAMINDYDDASVNAAYTVVFGTDG